MKNKITFDKNYIQGTKQETLGVYNTEPYLPIVTEQLKIECIADLKKEFRDKRNIKLHVASLCKKLNLFPSLGIIIWTWYSKNCMKGLK